MGYKTILVQVDNEARSAARVQMAAELAVRYGAHLVGLHAVGPTTGAYRMVNPGPAVIDQQIERAQAQGAAARERFDALADKAGAGSIEWRISTEDAVAAVVLHARYSDLVLLGQPGPAAEGGADAGFVRGAVLAAGRPVLLVPYAGTYPPPGRKVMVAWNAGREATRAVTDSLPILKAADEVTVVVVRPEGSAHGDVPGAEIGKYLTRHGVKVRVDLVHAREVDVGNLLLSRASDLSSDLVVLGAYGHSRFSELVLGGVTRTMLESMTVPVLMSH